MDISESAIQASEKGLNRLIEMTSRLNDLQVSNKDNDKIFFKIKDWEKKCFDCLNDDFNTPMLIAEIFNSSKLINEIYTNGDCGEREKDSKSNSDNDSILEILLGLRDKARANKDFELSDSIRDQLLKLGIRINDKD